VPLLHNAHDDPADGPAVGHGLEGGGEGGEWDLAADDGPHLSLADQLEDAGVDALAVGVGGKVVSGRALELAGVFGVGVAHTAEREVAEQDRPGHDPSVFRLDAGREPDEEVPAVERHAPERLGRHLAADRVERDVDAASVGGFEHGVGEIGLSVVDGEVGAKGSAQLDFLG
jgi:hypothetical protein